MNEPCKPDQPNGELPPANALTLAQWRARCEQLAAEVGKLVKENAELRVEKRVFASMITLPKEIKELADRPLEELLSMCTMDPPFDELVEQVLKEHQTQGHQ